MDLELKNLSVNLSNKKILKSVNLKVNNGEIISLLGASGCGKSTLLKTIAGIIRQDEGSIILGGKISDDIPTHKRKTVIVFQDFRLFPHMTVAENISFPLKMAGLNKSLCRRKAIELLKKVKLDGYEDRYVDEMSGGQIQRVALARALAAEPVVLLLDEPFSSLDINLRKEMRDLVSDLQREFKITTILVTHDQEEALTMSDRIAFMHEGEIKQYDSPENIFKNPNSKIVADYFSPGIYIDGEVKDKSFISDFFTIATNKHDGLYKCLIRPSAIEVIKDKSGDYIVNERIYLGENYLLRLNHIKDNLGLETIVSDNSPLIDGDRIRVNLKKDKLIYIAK